MAPSIAARLDTLLAELRANGSLTDPAVAAAFRAVPRHHFLPSIPVAEAYRDEAIPTKYAADSGHAISSSSQPSIMAIMLEQLQVRPGQRILEIGAGTGYNAALLAHLAGPSGQVVTLDLDDDLVAAARAHLAAAGFPEVQVIATDGALGYPPAAPYDRIILTVGAWDLTPAWHAQLKPGGRLVLPLEIAPGSQKSIALVKPVTPPADGRLFDTDGLRDCGFMRLRGALASPELDMSLGPEPGLALTAVTPLAAAAPELYAWLRAGGQPAATGLTLTGQQIWTSLGLWVGLNAPDVCTLSAGQGLAGRGWVPCLYQFGGATPTCLSYGLVTATGAALLGRAPGEPYPDREAAPAPFALYLWSYGPDPAPAKGRLRRLVAGWQAAGQPSSAGLSVRVYDRAALPPADAAAQAVLVEKPHCRLLLTWP